MNIRKSSLPVSKTEKLFLPKSSELSAIKSLWNDAKRRLVSSCSKITNYQDYYHSTNHKFHSFPGSNTDLERNADFRQTPDSPCSSEKSNSTPSIIDTLSKVRRLTHVYGSDEILLPTLVSTEEQLPVSMASDSIHHPEEVDKSIQEIHVKNSTKFGDRAFRLPTKAAAILGADDNLVFQSLHDSCPTSKLQHALFLDQKLHENRPKKPIATPDTDSADAFSKYIKSKRKIGIGSEVKEKIASFWKQSDQPLSSASPSVSTNYSSCTMPTHISNIPGGFQLKDMERLLRVGKSSIEQIKKWSNSFECLLHDKYGLALFHEFLRSEFSDENIEFWIACEEYRTITTNKKLQSRAEKIYNDFVGVQAAREVNLDSKTRQQTEIDIRNPNPHTFDQAQKRIQALMEKDSYQRFLRSELYGKLVRACDEYLVNQNKQTKDPVLLNKGPTISSLGITAQDLSKLTMTTSKLAFVPRGTGVVAVRNPNNNSNNNSDQYQSSHQHKNSVGGTSVRSVHPDEPSLPFSKSSLIFTPEFNN